MLTPMQENMRSIIARSGDAGIDRIGIAEALGKNQLYPWHYKLLDELVALGQITADRERIDGRERTVYIYRIQEALSEDYRGDE